jgi:hypothetical protein
MTQVDTRGPADAFLGGAQLGLNYRMRQLDREQDQAQFNAQQGLAQDRHALDVLETEHRFAEVEKAFQKDQELGRMWADQMRGSLAPRGAMPMMARHGVAFSPPGQDDDLHRVLDRTDSTDYARLWGPLLKDQMSVRQFRATIAALRVDGHDKLLKPGSEWERRLRELEESADPATGGMQELVTFQQAMSDAREGAEIARANGLPEEVGAAVGAENIGHEVLRREAETRRAEADAGETAEIESRIEAAYVRYDAAVAKGDRPDPKDVNLLMKYNLLNERSQNVSGRAGPVTKAKIEETPIYERAVSKVRRAQRLRDIAIESGDDRAIEAAEKAILDADDERLDLYERLYGEAAPSANSQTARPNAPTTASGVANPQSHDDWARAAVAALGTGRTKDEYKAWIRQNSGK